MKLVLYVLEGCPYCRNFMSKWNKILENTNRQYELVSATQDNKHFIKERAKIKQFPSMQIIHDDKVINLNIQSTTPIDDIEKEISKSENAINETNSNPEISKTIENINKIMNNKNARVILFHSNHCGHCKVFKPIWDKFKKLNSKLQNIDIEDYESTNDRENFAKMETEIKEKIIGVPTVKLLINGRNLELNSRDEHGLLKEIESNLSDKSMHGGKNINYKQKYYKYKRKYKNLKKLSR